MTNVERDTENGDLPDIFGIDGNSYTSIESDV